MTGRREIVFGLPLDLMTMSETIGEIVKRLDGGETCRHLVVNVPKALMAQEDDSLARAIRTASIVNADGTWLAVGARLSGVDVPERFTGFDLMQGLMARAATSGHSVYFFGATDEVLSRMIEVYRGRFPGLEVAGSRNGYFTDDESHMIAEDIRSSRAEMLFLGFPSPRKETWLADHIDATGVGFGMGVGGSFDVVAGLTKRAPVWVQQAGMEWLWRLAQEPRRMWRRYVLSAPPFFRLVLDERRQRRRGAD